MYCGQTRALLEPRQGADGKLPPCPEGPDELSGMSFHVVDLFDVAFLFLIPAFFPAALNTSITRNSHPNLFPGAINAVTSVRNAAEQSLVSPAGKSKWPKVVEVGLAQYKCCPLSLPTLRGKLSGDTLHLSEQPFYSVLTKFSFDWLNVCQTGTSACDIYGRKVERRSAFSRLKIPVTCKPEISAVRFPDVPHGVAGFSVEAKSISNLAIEEVIAYCTLSMLDCFFPDTMSDDQLVMANHVPLAFGVVSSGPMGFVIVCEWVGFIFYSVVSKPFFLGSTEHQTAIADAKVAFEDRRREDVPFLSLRIPYATYGFRNKSEDDIGIIFSNEPLRLVQLPVDTTWFVKVVSALNYLDRQQFPFEGMPTSTASASVSSPRSSASPRSIVQSRDKELTYRDIVAESPRWSLGPLYMYHLFKVYARLKDVMNAHQDYPSSLVRSHLYFGMFEVAVVTVFVGERDANEEDMQNEALMQQVAEAVYWLAKHTILYIDVRPANIRISRDGTTAYLIDYDDCVLLTEPITTAKLVEKLQNHVHAMQWITRYSVLASCLRRLDGTADVTAITEELTEIHLDLPAVPLG